MEKIFTLNETLVVALFGKLKRVAQIESQQKKDDPYKNNHKQISVSSFEQQITLQKCQLTAL